MTKLNSTNESLSRAIYTISSNSDEKNSNSSNNSSNQVLINKIEAIDSADCSWLTIMSGVNLDIFKGFANEHDLVDYFLNHAYSKNQTVIASLVFEIDNTSSVSQDRLAPHIKYKIRQNASFTYTTKKIRERYWYPSPRDWVNILFKRIIIITLEDQFNSKLFLKKACKIIFWSLILHTF
jgi:ATP-binding cassette subfamily A (ABC1) protein 2